MARNPRCKPNRVLGLTDGEWTNLKATITTYLDANADKEEIADTTIRALNPKLANDRIWNVLKSELGL